MKLHDLRPAKGSRRLRTRVGRGIAAGQGKTAGRGTKGQKSRTGSSIPAWFEGGQTPIHIRVPKLHGFKNRFRIGFEVVNVGQISTYAEEGRFGVDLETGKTVKAKADQPVTVNAEVLAQAGLIRGNGKPVKVLGQGEVSTKLFVAADAFSAGARQKIEAAGGFVQVLAPEVPETETDTAASEERKAKKADKAAKAEAKAETVESEAAKDDSEAPKGESEDPAAGSDASESAESEN
jgi:large subunit ribosomal protein L15